MKSTKTHQSKEFTMNILTQNIEKRFISCFLYCLNHDHRHYKSASFYLGLIVSIENRIHTNIRQALIMTFEGLDKDFKTSAERKALYYTKGKHPRTLMTLYGEIYFEREYYVPKKGGEGFFYVDRQLDLPRRDYYDPLIKSMLIDYCGSMSCHRAGIMVGKLIGERLQHVAQKRNLSISRQTVRNVLLACDIDNSLEPSDPLKVDTVYVQMDEKYVASQGAQGKKHEIKTAIVYTGIKKVGKHRNQLMNRKVFATTENADHLRRQLADYLSRHYAFENIRHILVSGDGASWIKASNEELRLHKNIQTSFTLDRFHMAQAINHITPCETERDILYGFIQANQPKAFKEVCEALLIRYPERTATITDKLGYIERHWKSIQHQKHPLFKGCSVEGHISHIFAALFASRPKGYSTVMLKKILTLRVMKANGMDLKKRYLENHTNYFHRDFIDIETSLKEPRNNHYQKTWIREMMRKINNHDFSNLKYI